MRFPTNDMKVVEYDPAEVDEFGIEVFDNMWNGLRAEKEQACKRRGAGTDIPAHLVYLPMQKSALFYITPATVGFDLPMQEMVTMVLSFLIEDIGSPRLIGFGADAAMKMFPKEAEQDAVRIQRGSILAGLHRDPEVRETLTSTVIHRRHESTELRTLFKMMPYHYDGRALIWDDDDGWSADSVGDDGNSLGGALEDIIRVAFAIGEN